MFESIKRRETRSVGEENETQGKESSKSVMAGRVLQEVGLGTGLGPILKLSAGASGAKEPSSF